MSRAKTGIDKLIRVAELYYYEKKSQAEIAEILGVSRPQVSKLLAQAWENNLITVTVHNSHHASNLSAYLRNIFDLNDCIVVRKCESDFQTEEALEKAAAAYVETWAAASDVVGLGWGNMFPSMASMLTETKKDVSGVIVPLIGSMSIAQAGYNTNELVRTYGEKLNMEPNYLYAPAFPNSLTEYQQFTLTNNYATISDLWSHMDTAIVRIFNYPCSPDHATASRFGNLLSERKAVGCVLSMFYDITGNVIDSDDNYCISIAQDQLQKIQKRIGLCVASTSPASVIGALQSKMVNCLILCEETAMQIVNQMRPGVLDSPI